MDRVPSAVEGLYSRADRVPSSAARVASEGKNGASTEKTTVFRPQNGPSTADVLPSDADRTLCPPPNFRRHGDELSVDAEWFAVESHAGALSEAGDEVPVKGAFVAVAGFGIAGAEC